MATVNGDILVMAAVVTTPAAVPAVSQTVFTALTLHVVQPDSSTAGICVADRSAYAAVQTSQTTQK